MNNQFLYWVPAKYLQFLIIFPFTLDYFYYEMSQARRRQTFRDPGLKKVVFSSDISLE